MSSNPWADLTPAQRQQIRETRVAAKVQEMSSSVTGYPLDGFDDTDEAFEALQRIDEKRSRPAHLWPCGCLRNDADAHRVGCPDYPEGRRGDA